MKTIEHLKQRYYANIEALSLRRKVINTVGADDKYLDETEKIVLENKDIKKQLADHYNNLKNINNGAEWFMDYYNRMQIDRQVDENGNFIEEPKFKLGVEVIDNEWLKGEGVQRGCLISIGADSGVGKTELVTLFIQSFCRQGRKVLFSSLEMGDIQLYQNAILQGKFDTILKNEIYSQNLMVDFQCSYIDDLQNAILIANRDYGIDVFVIDSYLPIITGHDSDVKKMEAVSLMLDELKRSLNITIIIIAQWSRSDSKMAHYDFSGGTKLKYLSDFVLFIEIFENSLGKNTMRKFTCAKNRVCEEKVFSSIITDFDRETRKLVKIGDENSPDVEKIKIARDSDGRIIKKLRF